MLFLFHFSKNNFASEQIPLEQCSHACLSELKWFGGPPATFPYTFALSHPRVLSVYSVASSTTGSQRQVVTPCLNAGTWSHPSSLSADIPEISTLGAHLRFIPVNPLPWLLAVLPTGPVTKSWTFSHCGVGQGCSKFLAVVTTNSRLAKLSPRRWQWDTIQCYIKPEDLMSGLETTPS